MLLRCYFDVGGPENVARAPKRGGPDGAERDGISVPLRAREAQRRLRILRRVERQRRPVLRIAMAIREAGILFLQRG
jgi:hypothetical protein